MLQVAVVVDEHHYPVLITLVQGGQQLAAGFAGTIDNHVFRQGAQLGLVIGAHRQAGTAYPQQRQGKVDERHGARHARLAEKHGGAENHGGVADSGQHRPDGLLPHEADDRAVQAEPQEHDCAEYHGDGGAGVLDRAKLEVGVAVAYSDSQPHGGAHKNHIQAE